MKINLPKEVSFSKEQRPYGWVYIFRHTQLGRLGRIILQGRTDGRTQIDCEVAGDPDDPMTEKRAAIFKPLGKKIADEMQRITNTKIGGISGATDSYTVPPKLPPEPRKGVARKLMQCEKCDVGIGLIILAPDAADEGGLEDYARLMYFEIKRYEVPTWVVGALTPSAGVDELNEPRCIIKKIHPIREAIFYASPEEFNAITDKLREGHCV